MPVRSRSIRSRRGELTVHQFWCLRLGCGGNCDFASDDERREAWELNREKIRMNEGCRPAAWWDFASPQPRDRSMRSALQLYRMGELHGDELAACLKWWRQDESVALARLGDGTTERQRFDYRATRREHGIPDDLIPPACDPPPAQH